jgi:hypothetical protein
MEVRVPQAKVSFRLERDDDGYPPFDIEGVWAERAEGGKFVLDNIPFFARQATLGDLVDVVYEDDEPFYEATVVVSENSLIRVVFFDEHEPAELRADLAEMGCSTELFERGSLRLIAVNVPASVPIADVRALLDRGCEEGAWDYEEAILRQ